MTAFPSTALPSNVSEDCASCWDTKSALLDTFSRQLEAKKDKQSLFSILEQMFHIEPFSVLIAVASNPHTLKLFASFLEQHKERADILLHSYNWDDRFVTYGSVNAGILMVQAGRLDLLKLCVKKGLSLEWQDHVGRNLLFYVCRTLHEHGKSKDTDILKFLLSSQRSLQLLNKKDWNGRTAYDLFCESKDISLRKSNDENLKKAYEEWDSVWQKHMLSHQLDISSKPKAEARKM